MNLTRDELAVFENLVRGSGREPGAYRVERLPDAQVRVTGPKGSAVYPRGRWIAAFSRHLDRAFFDAPGRAAEVLESPSTHR